MLIRRSEAAAPNAPLVLDGDELELISISIDGKQLAKEEQDWQRLTAAIAMILQTVE